MTKKHTLEPENVVFHHEKHIAVTLNALMQNFNSNTVALTILKTAQVPQTVVKLCTNSELQFSTMVWETAFSLLKTDQFFHRQAINLLTRLILPCFLLRSAKNCARGGTILKEILLLGSRMGCIN